MYIYIFGNGHCAKTCAYMDVYAYFYTYIFAEKERYKDNWVMRIGIHHCDNSRTIAETPSRCMQVKKWKWSRKGSKKGPSLNSEIHVCGCVGLISINLVHHPIHGH